LITAEIDDFDARCQWTLLDSHLTAAAADVAAAADSVVAPVVETTESDNADTKATMSRCTNDDHMEMTKTMTIAAVTKMVVAMMKTVKNQMVTLTMITSV
jgi:hypothetical protein